MYANQGKEIIIHTADCSESECIQDFELQYKKQLKYPGACSLYFQAALQVVCEFWDGTSKENAAKAVACMVDAEHF